MAQQIQVSIYGANSNAWGGTQGQAMTFPVGQIVLKQIAPAVTYGSASCVTQIQLLPTAPSTIQPVFYTPTAIGTLLTAMNA